MIVVAYSNILPTNHSSIVAADQVIVRLVSSALIWSASKVNLNKFTKIKIWFFSYVFFSQEFRPG